MVSLKSNHARAISTTLSKVEKDITDIEMHLRNRPQGRMYEVVDDLTDLQREDLLAKIASLRECIQEFANDFNLKVHRPNMSAIIGSKLAVDWANACDIKPENLGAYGAVDPEMARAIEPHVQRLVKMLS